MVLKASFNHWKHCTCVYACIYRDESFGWFEWVFAVWRESGRFYEVEVYWAEYFCEGQGTVEKSCVLAGE